MVEKRGKKVKILTNSYRERRGRPQRSEKVAREILRRREGGKSETEIAKLKRFQWATQKDQHGKERRSSTVYRYVRVAKERRLLRSRRTPNCIVGFDGLHYLTHKEMVELAQGHWPDKVARSNLIQPKTKRADEH